MSATNRGTKRKPYDFYETPAWCTEKLLPYLPHPIGKRLKILEPTAGKGAIIKVLRQRYNYMHFILGNELDANNLPDLEASGVSTIRSGNIFDFTNIEPEQNKTIRTPMQMPRACPPKFDLIIGNPPYSLAQECIQHCLKHWLGYNGQLIFLLRINFLGSKKRHTFWQNHPPAKLYVLSKRPSFTGKGTDATEYAWFVWQKQNGRLNQQNIHVL
jgi:hypothetical protein